MSKFKIGDKVRVVVNLIDDTDAIKRGDIGIVVGIDDDETYPIRLNINDEPNYGFNENELELVVSNEEEDVIDIDKHWTVENCYTMYKLAKLIRTKCGYKYSMTKNREYSRLKKEISGLMLIMEENCLSEINLEEIHDKVCDLYLKFKRLNREVKYL